MDALIQDVRYAVRSLRKSPGFTAVAVLMLALAIGANTAVFSVLHAVVLQPVAAQDPNGLAAISVTDARNHQPAYIYVDTVKAFRDGLIVSTGASGPPSANTIGASRTHIG
jgi:hypothetical protein